MCTHFLLFYFFLHATAWVAAYTKGTPGHGFGLLQRRLEVVLVQCDVRVNNKQSGWKNVFGRRAWWNHEIFGVARRFMKASDVCHSTGKSECGGDFFCRKECELSLVWGGDFDSNGARIKFLSFT